MVSVLRDNISSFFSKVQELGKNAVTSIWSALTTKVNTVSKSVFANVEGSQHILQAAGKAAQRVGDKALDFGMRTAAKTAMIAFRPDSKIKQHQTALKQITRNDDLANAVHAAIPHLTEKLIPFLGDQSKIKMLVKGNRKLCEKVAEAKLLEVLAEIAKKTQSISIAREGEGEPQDQFLMTMLTKLLLTSADHLKSTEFNQERLEKELVNLTKEFMGKVQKFVGTHIDRALLNKEKSKDAAAFNEAQTLAVELLQGLGAALGDEGQPVSVENCVKGIVKRFMQDGVTKLLFKMNDSLQSFQQKLGEGEMGKMPVDDFIKDLCQSTAKDATDTLIDSVVKPGERSEAAKAAIKNRKSVIQDVIENLFTLAFKWIGTLLGLIDKKGNLFPEHSWVSIVKKPFEALRRHWGAIKEAEQEKTHEKRQQKLQESFENIIEDTIQSYVGDSLASYLGKMYAKMAGQKEDEAQPGNIDEEQPGSVRV